MLINLISFLSILISVAFYTVAERKIMASVQRRSGPGFYGRFWGVFTGIFDGIKLLFKEILFKKSSNKILFFLSPILNFVFSLSLWNFMSFNSSGSVVQVPLNLLIIFGILSLNPITVLLAGLASDNRYSLMGAVRLVAQMISYELVMLFTVMPLAFITSSFDIDFISSFSSSTICFGLVFLPLSLIFWITTLAETNRAPFDLPESESELVAGFHVEYSGILFAFFFLAEYSNMMFMSLLNVKLFWGGWNVAFKFLESSVFILKASIFFILTILVRASYPRFRFEQVIALSWKKLLPVSLSYIVFVIFYFF